MTKVAKLLLARAKVRTGENENESFVINNHKWVPEWALEEGSEEEEFDLLKIV